MRSISISLTLALALLGGCADEEPIDDEPPIELANLYRVAPTYCRGYCPTLTLYRSTTQLELRAHQADGSYVGRTTATLADATLTELDAHIDAVLSGEQELGEAPGHVVTDAPLVTLWLAGLRLDYTEDYPPSGLVELDALLHTILLELGHCEASSRVELDPDCEPFAETPD